LLYEHGRPGEAALRLNDMVSRYRLSTGFVTAIVGVYATESGNLDYVLCGHEPGLVHRAATGEITSLEASGPPIGAYSGAQYPERRLKLYTGDTLLLFTDGLTEAGPSPSEFLGPHGVAALFERIVAGPDIRTAAKILIDDVMSYAKFGLRDDVCVLIARRNEPLT